MLQVIFFILPIIYCREKSIKNIKENEYTELFIITFIKFKISIIFFNSHVKTFNTNQNLTEKPANKFPTVKVIFQELHH